MEEIEKVFNETFVPASDHDFVPISSNVEAARDQEDTLGSRNFNATNKRQPDSREIFFVHRSIVPDPDEVIAVVSIYCKN